MSVIPLLEKKKKKKKKKNGALLESSKQSRWPKNISSSVILSP